MKGRPDDWTRIVRAKWRNVRAYIVSGAHPPCIKMAKDEIAHVDRVMTHVLLEDVRGLMPGKHWFMAVVLCPGDDLHGLAEWAKGQDASRIHFYLHKDTSAQALAPWRHAGLPLSRIEEERFSAYGRMHARLGLDLSDQVYGDFAP